MSQTLGAVTDLQLVIPEAGEKDWDVSIRDNCFQKIVDHDHTGASGLGKKLSASAFAADALDFSVINGDNDQYLTARNAADSADINIIKVNSSNTLTLGATLASPTITSPVLTTPEINDTSSDHQYIFAVSELAADRTVTLPLLTGNDTFVFNDFAATLTNKTIDADSNTITNIENADIKAAAAIALNKLAAATASRALVSDGSGFITAATTTATEIGYVNGVTSAIQTQIDSKLPTTITTTGDIIYSSSGTSANRLAIGSSGQVLQVSGGVPVWGTNTASPVSPTSKTTTYTALTTDDTILADTSGGAWALTLYAASGNGGRRLKVVKTTSDTNALTIDANASETMDGKLTITLNRQYDNIALLCDGTNWVVEEENTTNEVFLHTANGHGSTNTKVRRFSTQVHAIGDAITYADSSANGMSMTINRDGMYCISYTDLFDSSTAFGISLNSAELTTNINGLTTVADRIALGSTSAAGLANNVCVTKKLVSGDVIRAHDNGASGGNSQCSFTITKVGK